MSVQGHATPPQRTKTLSEIIPQYTSNQSCRTGATLPSLKLMGMDWVFLEETQKNLNIKQNLMKNRLSLQLQPSSPIVNRKQSYKLQQRSLNCKLISSPNGSSEIRTLRSTMNTVSKLCNPFNEGLSTGCITTPSPNLLGNTRKQSILSSFISATGNTSRQNITHSVDQPKEIKKRYRTDPCRLNTTFVDNQDISEQEELNQIWNSAIENPSSSQNLIVEERVNSIFQQLEEEEMMKEQEEVLLNKYKKQMQKKTSNDFQDQNNSKQISEYNNLQKILQKDKSFSKVYTNKYRFYQNCFSLNLQNPETLNAEMNENQRYRSKVEESNIPLQAIYNKKINLEKELKQIYMKYEKNPIEIKVPSSHIMKNLVEKRCRRKSWNNSQFNQKLRNGESDVQYSSLIKQQSKENDEQICEMYKDSIQDKILKGYPVSKQLQIQIDQQQSDNTNNNSTKNDICKSIRQVSLPPYSVKEFSNNPTIQNSNNKQQQYNLEIYEINVDGLKQDTRSKSVVDKRVKINHTIKLPHLQKSKINKPYVNTDLIDNVIPNIRSKHVKSKIYDSYYIEPSQRFKLYQLKIENINLIKDIQRNYNQQQFLFQQN